MAKILLVEDDKSLREIYGVRLMAEGYQIVSAGDGEEALALAIKERPDLIVSDVMMPKISGFDMLDILRSTTETKDVKVIMMTALSSDDQRARGEALGADRYLVKSQVGIEDVVRTVHDVLGDGLPGVAAPATIAAPSFASGGAPQAAPQAPAPEAMPAPMPAPAPVAAPEVSPVYSQEPVVIPSAADLAPQAPAPEAMPAPMPAPAPAPSPQAAPMAQPQPMAPPAPAPQVEAPAMPQQPMQPAQAPVQMPAPSVPLPQPTAPFSSPAPASLGQRIIEPLTAPAPIDGSQSADISAQMAQALNSPVSPQPTPNDPSQPPLQ